jgi:hypothetical protein
VGLPQILSLVIGIGSLVCWIIVLVKIFQSGNILMGILGICPLVAFIYGWVKNEELGIRQIMTVWTILIIAGFIVNIAFASQLRPR